MIRLYGTTLGNGSWSRVTAGIRGALKQLDRLAGFVPLDVFDEEAVYPGHDAEVAVFVGPPPMGKMMTSIGWHKRRYAILAPNSSWLPRAMLEQLSLSVTGFVSPSKWGADVIGVCLDAMDDVSFAKEREPSLIAVSVWPHGIAEGFTSSRADHESLTKAYDRGEFFVTHLSSSQGQRKGTAELLMAWAGAVRSGSLGEAPMLRLVVDGAPPWEAAESAARGDEHVMKSFRWLRRMDYSVAGAAEHYRAHHLVCQPSRGEGFGMVPLEALACGIPILATQCTGHSEWYPAKGLPGAISVNTLDDGPIDDGPDATAPTIDVADLESKLGLAWAAWRALGREAQRNAPNIRAEWSWVETTRTWLESEGL